MRSLTDEKFRRSNRKSARVLYVALAMLLAYFLVVNPYDRPMQVLVQGALIVTFGSLPIAVWLRSPRNAPVPILGLYFFFYVIAFGVAGFIVPERAQFDLAVADDDYSLALNMTGVALLATAVGYQVIGRAKIGNAPRVLRLDDPRYDQIAIGVAYPTVLILEWVARQMEVAGASLLFAGIHQFLFIWALYAAWRGRLPRVLRLIVLLGILPFELLVYSNVANGQLGGVLVYGQIISVTYAAAKGRFPVWPIVAVFGLFVVLEPVKGEFRDATWRQGYSPGPLAGALLFANLASESIQRSDWSFGGSVDRAYARINDLQTTAAVGRDASESDFLDGATFLPILSKLVPRFLWPDKPSEDSGNRWARQFGYIGPGDFTTSFNLPWLTEMYINFGWAGVVGVSILVGALISFITRWLVFGAQTPTHFAAALTVGSAFFWPESNLSLQIGSALIALLGILTFMHLFSIIPRRAEFKREMRMPRTDPRA